MSGTAEANGPGVGSAGAGGGPEIVADPALITPEWMTAALGASGAAVDGATVVELSVDKVGTGQVGDSFRLHLLWDRTDPRLPATVVAKLPAEDPVSRNTGVMTRCYEREVGFYRSIASTVGIRRPHCHYADIDMSNGDFTLVLSDLAPAVQGDQIQGCGVDDAALALSEAVGLHAPRWGDATLWDHQQLVTPPEYGAFVGQMFMAFWPSWLETYAPALPPGGEDFGVRFAGLYAAFNDLGDDRSKLTITHGDYRLDNMLFDRTGAAPTVSVVDWQTTAMGRAVNDVAYFLGAGLSIPDRRAHEWELVRSYHRQLVATGVDYPWHACERDYRVAALHGVSMSVMSASVVTSDERGVAMFSAMAERHFTHAMDTGALDLLT